MPWAGEDDGQPRTHQQPTRRLRHCVLRHEGAPVDAKHWRLLRSYRVHGHLTSTRVGPGGVGSPPPLSPFCGGVLLITGKRLKGPSSDEFERKHNRRASETAVAAGFFFRLARLSARCIVSSSDFPGKTGCSHRGRKYLLMTTMYVIKTCAAAASKCIRHARFSHFRSPGSE